MDEEFITLNIRENGTGYEVSFGKHYGYGRTINEALCVLCCTLKYEVIVLKSAINDIELGTFYTNKIK